jgi:esterase/lipase superfamily enzyme
MTDANRRQFLKTAGAVGIAGVTLGTGTAAAGGGAETLSAPDDYPRVSTRDHYEITWWGSVERADDESATSYDVRGDWSGLGSAGELLVFVHGWRSDDGSDDAIDRAYTAGKALEEVGYDEFDVAFSWDSDKGGGLDQGWYEGQEIANRNGSKLANFVTDWNDADGRPVRLVCHSLGAQVTLSALSVLDSWGRANAVRDVVMLGGAADNEACSVGGEYGDGIATAAEEVVNCHKTDDDVLQWAYSIGEFNSAVGETGVEGTPPGNYRDVNVTDAVPDHYSYPELAEDGGCMDVVVDNW